MHFLSLAALRIETVPPPQPTPGPPAPQPTPGPSSANAAGQPTPGTSTASAPFPPNPQPPNSRRRPATQPLRGPPRRITRANSRFYSLHEDANSDDDFVD